VPPSRRPTARFYLSAKHPALLIGFLYQRGVYTEAGLRQALVAIADWGGRAALIPRAAVDSEPAIGSLREHGLRA
jgi:hypothetical protein